MLKLQVPSFTLAARVQASVERSRSAMKPFTLLASVPSASSRANMVQLDAGAQRPVKSSCLTNPTATLSMQHLKGRLEPWSPRFQELSTPSSARPLVLHVRSLPSWHYIRYKLHVCVSKRGGSGVPYPSYQTIHPPWILSKQLPKRMSHSNLSRSISPTEACKIGTFGTFSAWTGQIWVLFF